MALNPVYQDHLDGALAVCRRNTSEVSEAIFANTVALIVQPIWRQNHLPKLPKSGRIVLSHRLLDDANSRDMVGYATTSGSHFEVVALPNDYLVEMIDAIRPCGGYINHSTGDAIVSIFGALIDQPDIEWRAVAAALAVIPPSQIEDDATPCQTGIA